MTPFGVVVLAVFAVVLIWNPQYFGYALALIVPFPQTAVIVVGKTGINAFYIGAIVATLIFLVRMLAVRESRSLVRSRLTRSTLWFGLFVIYAAFITLLGPKIFSGFPVMTPRGGLEGQVGHYSDLSYSISNFGQLAYLLLGAGVLAYFASQTTPVRHLLDVTFAVGYLTLFAALIVPSLSLVWPSRFFENMPNVDYMIYADRLRGAFAEPSTAGVFLAGAVGYFACAAIFRGGRKRVFALAMLALGLANLVFTSSGSAVIGLAVTGVVSICVLIYVRIRRGRKRSRLGIAIFIGAGVIVVAGIPFVYQLVVTKLGTSSFSVRTTADLHAINLFMKTWGIGLGLGSDRPSGLFAMLLSDVGLLGFIFFMLTVIVFARAGWRTGQLRPATWALIAIVSASFIGIPELSTPVLWLALAVCASGLGPRELSTRQSEAITFEPAVWHSWFSRHRKSGLLGGETLPKPTLTIAEGAA